VLAKLRGKRTAASEGSAEGGRELGLEGLYVSWQKDAARLEVFGAHAARKGPELSLGADLARVAAGKLALDARGLFLGSRSNEGRRRVSRVETRALDLRWLSEQAPPASPEAGNPAAPRGPPADGVGR
jgi:hypothetical protein